MVILAELAAESVWKSERVQLCLITHKKVGMLQNLQFQTLKDKYKYIHVYF